MDPHPHSEGGAYEKSDALFGPTLRAGLAILGAMLLTALLVVPMYRFLVRRATSAQEQPVTVLTTDALPAEPSFPKLVESEPRVLAEFRAQERALLTSYGWVEKDRGIVRIPIEDAMSIVAVRGALPAFPTPAPAEGGAR